MKREVFQQHPEKLKDALPIGLGGTGKKTAVEALVALDGAPSASIGTPNGIVPLDSRTMVPDVFLRPVSSVSVSAYGPLATLANLTDAQNYAAAHLGEGSITIPPITLSFTISDYDFATEYVVTCKEGAASRNAATITYTPPNYGCVDELTINGVVYSITVTSGIIYKPVITSPANGDTINKSRVTVWFTPLTASYKDQWGNTFDFQQEFAWQLAADAAFTNIVQEDSGNLAFYTSFNATNLSKSTQYYFRCKYRGYVFDWSEWSDAVSFVTGDVFIPTDFETKIHQYGINPSYDTKFGHGLNGLSMSADAKKIVATSSYNFDYGNKPILFIHNFDPNDPNSFNSAPNFTFGCVDNVGDPYADIGANISGDGNTCCIAYNTAAGVVLRLFKCNNQPNPNDNIWIETWNTVLYDPQSGSSEISEYTSIAIDYDGSVVAVGVPRNDGTGRDGVVYVFRANNGVYTENPEIIRCFAPLPAQTSFTTTCFGYFVNISDDGGVLLVGAFSDNGTAGLSFVYGLNYGSYDYEHGNIQYLHQQTFTPIDTGEAHCLSQTLSRDGNTAAISAGLYSDPAQTTSVYVFKCDNGVWGSDNTFQTPLPISNNYGHFGNSVALNADGKVLAIASTFADGKNWNVFGVIPQACGETYIYTHGTSGWSMKNTLEANDSFTFDQFGTKVLLSASGEVAAISAPNQQGQYSYWDSDTRYAGIYVFN